MTKIKEPTNLIGFELIQRPAKEKGLFMNCTIA